MTIQQALKEIKSKPKWYFIDGIDDTRLCLTARNIELGLAKEETKRKFFARFGYNFEINEEVTPMP